MILAVSMGFEGQSYIWYQVQGNGHRNGIQLCMAVANSRR